MNTLLQNLPQILTYLAGVTDTMETDDRRRQEAAEIGAQSLNARVAAQGLRACYRKGFEDGCAYEAAHQDNLCDACCGTGKPISQLPCMCRGTGKMSEAARHLRAELVSTQEELAAEQEEALRQHTRAEDLKEQLAKRDVRIEKLLEAAKPFLERDLDWDRMHTRDSMKALQERRGKLDDALHEDERLAKE